MELIDALGPDFSPETAAALLSESTDPQLEAIVAQAASGLQAPMAIVTVVVDRMQYFLAHHGLPPDLRASRGTERSASFCQFVVRDARTFEVTDAASDERLPKLLVEEFGLAAYLGVPVRAGDRVVGSLCVLDTEARGFSPLQHDELGRLAAAVDQRLSELASQRRQSSQNLTRMAMGPGLSELRRLLNPLTSTVGHISPALAAIRSFLRLREFAAGGGATSPRFVAHAQAVALEALADCEASLYDMEALAADALDAVSAIEQLQSDHDGIAVSVAIHAAQDLARPVTDAVGGARITSLGSDPLLQVPRGLAVGFLTAALTAVAGAVLECEGASGIEIEVATDQLPVLIALRANGLGAPAYETLARDLAGSVGDDPSVSVVFDGDGVVLRLAAASAA